MAGEAALDQVAPCGEGLDERERRLLDLMLVRCVRGRVEVRLGVFGCA